jgi:hypothetical protein
MIMDRRTLFCENEACQGTAATRLEGSQIDLEDARDIGNGQPLYLIITVDVAFVGATATVNFKLASDATAAVATDGTATEHAQTGPIPIAQLVVGKTFVLPLPAEGNVYEQFLGLLVVTAVATTTAGSVTAFLSPDPAGWKAYPEAAS